MAPVRRRWGWPGQGGLDDPAVIEALVAEAERGYDSPRAEFARRPPDPEIDPLRRIVFRVSAEVRDAAQKQADAEERSLSELAAKALERHLEETAAARKRRRKTARRDPVREKSQGP